MILGMDAFTFVHVLISVIAIASGSIVMLGLLISGSYRITTLVFLTTTVLTSITGFGFPFKQFLPSHAVGILSLLVLAPTIYAYYVRKCAGIWRKVYVIGATIALYLNVFVFVAQAFLKIPALAALAPTQSSPVFIGAQCVVIAAFIALGVTATITTRRTQLALASVA